MAYDPSVYESQRRAIEQRYGAEGAMQAYSRFLTQQRGQRQQQNLSEQYRKAFPQLMSSYGRRGLAGPNVKSGIARSGLSELAKKQIADYGDLQQGMQQEMRQYDLQSAMREADLYGGFSDLEAQKARQIAEDAQILLARRAGAY
jgi:hypothetical protein